MTRSDYRRELLRDLLDVARNYRPDLTSADERKPCPSGRGKRGV